MIANLTYYNLHDERSSTIKIIGIGGCGINALNRIYEKGVEGVGFIVCNTDNQSLTKSPVRLKVLIGKSIQRGIGMCSASTPEIGRKAAIENLNDIMVALKENTKMVLITTGMGGSTGTGAAPVIAKACKEAGLLTIAIVTIPFKSEGKVRVKQAIDGIIELKDNVDSLLVINNEKLREIYGNLPASTVFTKSDDILVNAVKSILEIITVKENIWKIWSN